MVKEQFILACEEWTVFFKIATENFKTICDEKKQLKFFFDIYLDAYLINSIFYNAECGNYTILKNRKDLLILFYFYFLLMLLLGLKNRVEVI